MARTIAQKTQTKGLSEYRQGARGGGDDDDDDDACVTGSVLIPKTSFMGRRGSDDGRNLKKGRGLEGECWRSSYERKEPGTMATA